MSKGVAPVLATVLIVLIAMFLVGGVFVYLSQTQAGITERASEEEAAITDRMLFRYEIQTLECGRAAGEDFMVLKNTGERALSGDSITILVNGDTIAGPVSWTAAGDGCTVSSAGRECLLRGQFPAAVDPARGDSVSALVGQTTETRVCL